MMPAAVWERSVMSSPLRRDDGGNECDNVAQGDDVCDRLVRIGKVDTSSCSSLYTSEILPIDDKPRSLNVMSLSIDSLSCTLLGNICFICKKTISSNLSLEMACA